jgi:uncharacterized protein YqgV (UPF0045/DUF77 family)
MDISVEISMYPLQEGYIPPIQSFIDELNTNTRLVVQTNTMSTQIFGPYDEVMTLLQEKIKPAFESDQTIIMALKIINKDLRP